jgi:hypothetical protein
MDFGGGCEGGLVVTSYENSNTSKMVSPLENHFFCFVFLDLMNNTLKLPKLVFHSTVGECCLLSALGGTSAAMHSAGENAPTLCAHIPS